MESAGRKNLMKSLGFFNWKSLRFVEVEGVFLKACVTQKGGLMKWG